ncbi:unnamed protein product [Ectocarpus sp. 6 AP-2014]
MDVTGEDEWSDWEDEDIPARSLFEDKLLPSAKARSAFCALEALKYDSDTYDFDLFALRTKLGLDFYGCVKLVNYVRTEVSSASGGGLKDVAASIEAAVVASKGEAFADER